MLVIRKSTRSRKDLKGHTLLQVLVSTTITSIVILSAAQVNIIALNKADDTSKDHQYLSKSQFIYWHLLNHIMENIGVYHFENTNSFIFSG